MKMDLNDTGILLIVRIDTKERLENAIAITEFLVKHFNPPIYMWEIDAYNNGFLKKLIPTKVKYLKSATNSHSD